MIFKAGKRQILSLAMGIIILAGTFSLAGCITLSPGPSTQDNAGSTSTSAEPSQGMKVASLKGATLGNTGVFSKVAVNTTIDNDSSLVSYSAGGNAINGQSDSGYGIYGRSKIASGVYGTTDSGAGIQGIAYKTGNAIEGLTYGSGNGIYGKSISVAGYAGNFQGNVKITGTLTKAAGTFKIDHPQDPANKYLSHSFVESPDMMNVYNGNITLDANGEAIVALPAYFESLNRDFRYQLTCIGGYAPVYVAEKVKDNSFKIAGGKAGIEVSWQVTGVRQDAFAKAHPVIVEQEKPANEKGFYLHPIELGLPAEKGIK